MFCANGGSKGRKILQRLQRNGFAKLNFRVSDVGSQEVVQRILSLRRVVNNMKCLHGKQMATLISQMTADFACSNLEVLGTESVYFLADAISAPFKALVPFWLGSNFGYKLFVWLVAVALLLFFILGL